MSAAKARKDAWIRARDAQEDALEALRVASNALAHARDTGAPNSPDLYHERARAFDAAMMAEADLCAAHRAMAEAGQIRVLPKRQDV